MATGGGSITVKIDEAALQRLAVDAVTPVVDQCLDAGVASAKRLVPIDTGELQAGIEVKERAHEEAGEVVGTYGVDDVEHALPVEFGSTTGPEQPYLRPSIDAVKQGLG